eukprot:7376666-Prymnesium_polylepis.3
MALAFGLVPDRRRKLVLVASAAYVLSAGRLGRSGRGIGGCVGPRGGGGGSGGWQRGLNGFGHS